MCSATFLRPSKHVSPNSKELWMKIWGAVPRLVLFLHSFHSREQLGDVSCGSAFTGVGIRGKKGRRMKREKRRAQGHFKTSSLCLQLTGQGKRKPTETTACQRNKQTQQQISSLFLGAEQSIRNCHKIILSPYLKGKKIPIFNMALFFLPIS